MTEEEWAYHFHRGRQVGSLGFCSRLRNGLIKIEGYEPRTFEQLPDWVQVSRGLDELRALP